MQHTELKKAIIRSQHCQRNWDLTRTIPKEDLELLVTAVTQCPSKQNVAFYRLHFITNRELIETIHSYTNGFVTQREPEQKTTTNSQTLANLLVVFEDYFDISNPIDSIRNVETRKVASDEFDAETKKRLTRDQHVAVGIAAGYLNLTASQLGYSTGCCNCMDSSAVRKAIGITGAPLLLMGIGFKDPNKNRRVHHQHDFVFPAISKQEIQVNFID